MRTGVHFAVGLALFGFLLAYADLVSGAIIGTNTPSQPLTAARVSTLPKASRSDWEGYLARSDKQRRADQAFLQKEMRQHGVKQLLIPPEARFNRLLPLNRPADWYGTPEARHIADVVVSFQTPAGGWSKNLNMTGAPRAPGMHFVPDNSSRFLGDTDFDVTVTNHWNYVGTFDNDGTIMQLRFLAKVIDAVEAKPGASYRAAFRRGLDYILAAQYPNGGWPQVWPLQGGYHDAVTFNDGAFVNILTLLREVSGPTNTFDFLPRSSRRAAAEAERRGIEFVLATQIVEAGHPTVWGQQHDPLTLRPTSARNYEMPSQAAGESAGVMMFLMQLREPDARTVAAVHAAAAWFEKTAIRDVAFKGTGEAGRLLVSAPGNGPIWSRYYEIGTDRPIFGERDKTIHDTVAEISRERRNGYSWYLDSPKRALEQYARWSKVHPR